MDYSNIHHVAFATELSTQLATYEIMNVEKSGDEQVYELYVYIPLKTPEIDCEGSTVISLKHTLAFVRNIERANIYKRLYNDMLFYAFNMRRENKIENIQECQLRIVKELSVSKGHNNIFENTLKNLNRLETRMESKNVGF
jgi:hypothetical protein